MTATGSFDSFKVDVTETVEPVVIAFCTHTTVSEFPESGQSRINVFDPPSWRFVNAAVDGPLTRVAWVNSPAAGQSDVQMMEYVVAELATAMTDAAA